MPLDPGMLQGLQDSHTQASGAFKAAQQSLAMLSKVRKEMDGLTKLGENISADDVMRAAGVLVAGGLGAKAVAGMLSTMPQGGQAIASWISQQDQQVQQQEAQAKQQAMMLAHQSATAGMQLLHAHDVNQQPESVPPAGQPPMSGPPPSNSAPASKNPFLPQGA